MILAVKNLKKFDDLIEVTQCPVFMHFRWMWLLIALLTGPFLALGQTNATVRSLSLNEAIRLALKHNLDLQIERVNPEIAGYALGGAYGIYDPTLNLGARQEYVDMPAYLDPKKEGVDNAYELKSDIFESALQGQLPTGLRYDLGGNAAYLRSHTEFLDPSLFPGGVRDTNSYTGDVGIALRQPLLRDFWIDANRQRIRVEKKNLKISELALQQQIINVLTKVQLAYYDLLHARESIKVRERALTLSQQLLAENRRRVQVGDLPPLDEKQAESQVELDQADLLAAQHAYLEQQNLLKTLLADDYRAWLDVQIEPTEPLIPIPVPFDRAASWQVALTTRPDLLQFRLELEKRDIVLRYQHNQLFPSLDLVGSYGARATGNEFGHVTEDIGDIRFPAYSYGVVLSFPLSNRSARNNYKAAQAAKKQAQLQLKKLEQEILAQIETTGRLTDTQYKRVRSTHQARLYAEAALEAEQRKLRNGVSTSFIVLELQKDLTDARLAEIRALGDYNKALVQLAFTEGTTAQKNGLSLEVR
jgi:outer membrane protein